MVHPAIFFNIYVPLYEAALKDEWEKEKEILNLRLMHWTQNWQKHGIELIILRVATGTKQAELVEELVKLMDAKDLPSQNKYNNTALCFAAASGIVRIAEVMVTKKRAIVIGSLK